MYRRSPPKCVAQFLQPLPTALIRLMCCPLCSWSTLSSSQPARHLALLSYNSTRRSASPLLLIIVQDVDAALTGTESIDGWVRLLRTPYCRPRKGVSSVLLACVSLLPPDADADDDAEGHDENYDHGDPFRVLVPPVELSMLSAVEGPCRMDIPTLIVHLVSICGVAIRS